MHGHKVISSFSESRDCFRVVRAVRHKVGSVLKDFYLLVDIYESLLLTSVFELETGC